jgi:hypothetical protein
MEGRILQMTDPGGRREQGVPFQFSPATGHFHHRMSAAGRLPFRGAASFADGTTVSRETQVAGE